MNGIATVVVSKRTEFPLPGAKAVDNVTVFLGCMKAIEETGTPGWIYGANGTREIRNVKVTITFPDAKP